MPTPIVAIVGRPNVGKSTLLNRVVGHRLAIVEDIPGTTRDRLYADIAYADRDFTLVDTGGFEAQPGSEMLLKVKEQVAMAISEADVIIFLLAVDEGITASDLDIADMLRRSRKPVVLAANKADNPQRESMASEFYRLGLGDPVPLSAYYGIGSNELLDRVVDLLPTSTEAAPLHEEGMKVAIVGRPNVGKSLLLNAILGKERAIVNSTPGTTRDALDTCLEYEAQKVWLIDTAGIRARGKVERGVEQYSVIRALKAIERADVALLVIDATEPLTAQDTHVAGYIHQASKGMVLIVNKWDLVTVRDELYFSQELRRKLKFMPYAPILFVSAKLGTGIGQVLPAAAKVYQERLKVVPVAELDQLVEEAITTHPPPSKAGRQLKLYTTTQVGVNPPTFVFKVNNTKLVHFSYQRYLENKLRRAFGFSGTPLRLIFQSKKRQGKGKAG